MTDERVSKIREHIDALLAHKPGDGPPRGMPRYRFFCPSCQRHGVQAWHRILAPELPVDPETFTCPDCNVKVEILGRDDQ